MKSYLEISITASSDQREMLIPTMLELGCEGFQETDTALLCYIPMDRWNPSRIEVFKKDLRNRLQIISSNAIVGFREIEDQNWNEEWEKTIQPIEICDRIVIKPSWAEYENRKEKIVIQIDPKMSFGTGYHETTRLILCLLEKYTKAGSNVLDVGTGTGVLAIAAVKLGAASATGTDIDDWALENAHENVIANAVQASIKISNEAVDTFPCSHFNLVTANLTLNTNVELLADFRNILCHDGILLLSGLLDIDHNTMTKELLRQDFQIIEIVRENEWVAIAARKQ